MNRFALWFLCLVALVSGIGYAVSSHASLVVTLAVISLPCVLAVLVGVADQQGRG